MRPLGHTETRNGRDVSSEPIDTRLQKAWEEYIAIEHHDIQASFGEKNFDSALHTADALLRPITPTLQSLQHFAIATGETAHDWEQDWYHLGVFLTAGLQRLPEHTIHWGIDTPTIHKLEYLLRNKHLVIDGTIGQNVGECMIGRLTINGTAGPSAGHSMIGHFTNNGSVGPVSAAGMIGVLTNTGAFDKHMGLWGVGQSYDLSPHSKPLGYPMFLWHQIPFPDPYFLRAIENPDGIPYGRLYTHLTNVYPRWKPSRLPYERLFAHFHRYGGKR
jgi:hypothetical protein